MIHCKDILGRLVVYLFIVFSSYTYVVADNPGIIPKPVHIDYKVNGAFIVNEKTRFIVENNDQAQVLKHLTACFTHAANWHFSIEKKSKVRSNYIALQTNSKLDEEAYKISVTNQFVVIEASNPKGFYYAIQTMRQLLPPEINSPYYIVDVIWHIPAVSIVDKPRFGYRGFMLDVARYFMPKEDVKRLIDYLAFHKINYFHWHLVDDNGWRIEIKKYPRLTDIGAWRVNSIQPFPMRANPMEGEAAVVGGYYTQEDIREIVQFAKERFIEIIPEIEMPAHTNSSLAAYPNLACPVVDTHIGVLPGIGGKNADIIYCAGNDSVFTFLENVLAEIITLFPSPFIHIGGDEANKENWEKCPKCRQRMRDNHIINEEELQSYFIRRINQFLKENGKRLMGWDELTDSEIPENAVIFGWRNNGSGGEKAGEKGFQYIKCPAIKYYFIRYQGPQWFEPYTYFGNTTLKDVYEYEPVLSSSSAVVTANMLGVEACLWTEFVHSADEAEYLIFPRLAAFAETAWSDPVKNWEGFVQRLDWMLKRYDALGINYAESMYNIEHEVFPENEQLRVTLSNIRPDTEIRYTCDGTTPKITSDLYTEPLVIEPSTLLKAVTFKSKKAVGKLLSLNTFSHKAVGMDVLSAEPNAFLLTNGLRGSEKLTDGEWIDVYDKDATFDITLDRLEKITQVGLSFLNNSGMGVHLPSTVSILVSPDGISFYPVYDQELCDKDKFRFGVFKTTLSCNIGEQEIQYVRVCLTNPGKTPETHIRAGISTRFAMDEIIIN